jgi:hypothetical protein
MHALAYLFIAVAIFLRFAVALEFLPYPFSFAAVGAALLFFGARGPMHRWYVPLGAFILADLALTRFVYNYAFPADQLASFAWYGAILWLGTRLRRDPAPLKLAGAALTASVSFFLVSNFAVWAVWNLYPKTLEGLLMSYAAGVPFFRWAPVGDLFFVALFFGSAALLEAMARSRAQAAA